MEILSFNPWILKEKGDFAVQGEFGTQLHTPCLAVGFIKQGTTENTAIQTKNCTATKGTDSKVQTPTAKPGKKI